MNKILRGLTILFFFFFLFWIPFNIMGLIEIAKILKKQAFYKIERMHVKSYQVKTNGTGWGPGGYANPIIIAKVGEAESTIKLETNNSVVEKNYLKLFQFEINNYTHFLHAIENNNDSIWVWSAPDAPLIYARNEQQRFSTKKSIVEGFIRLISILIPIVVVFAYVYKKKRKTKYEKS